MVCKLGREKPRQCCCRWPSRGTAPSKNSSLRRRTFTQGKHGSHDEQSDMSSSGTTTIGCRYFYYLLLLAYSFFYFYPKLSWLFQFVSAIFFLIVEFCYKHLLLVSCWEAEALPGMGLHHPGGRGTEPLLPQQCHWVRPLLVLSGEWGNGMTVYRSFPYFPTPFNGIYHEISRFLLLKAVLNVVLVSIPLGMMITRDESCSTEAPEAEDQKL